MTTSFLIHTAAVDSRSDVPWRSDEPLRIGESPSGRRRQRQSSPWASFVPDYRYATNSFVGDFLGKSEITMLQKTHKEHFSKFFADIQCESLLVKDSQNPFLLLRYESDKLLEENDEDNFYQAIRKNYSHSLKETINAHPAKSQLPYIVDSRKPTTTKQLLATFYGRQTHVTETIDLTKLSDHLCFDDGDDKVYNYNLRSSSLLASSVHPLLRPSLLNFRKRRPMVLSKGRSSHRRGSTTSCSTLSSFESFSSFTHIKSCESSPSDAKKSPSVLGSSLRILLQTNHHQKVAPTSVSVPTETTGETIFDTIILNVEAIEDDDDGVDAIDITDVQVNTRKLSTKQPREPNDHTETTKESAKLIEKATTDYNKSEASLDFGMLEKPKKRRARRISALDDTPLSMFQPSVSTTQAESSSGLMFLFDPSSSV
ncbi:hypothetical protein FisN_16Lh107 [Fistulifera solaris]|uniref:Uncharacterized protein n=1 Tax=Fistulifera solaris TaxID=1519565 RepID=A0A1Z5KJ50_FISSO|nr:hypothetical protein FisN_16Lh107 [Fistulifera solaris]|eukprot:GAX26276.1 hypothetical protein FisN_16Lh107 [Fistulifera solaris]